MATPVCLRAPASRSPGGIACGYLTAPGDAGRCTATHTKHFAIRPRTGQQRLRQNVLDCKRKTAESFSNGGGKGRGLLRQMPPRPVRMRLLIPSLAGIRQKNPGGRKSPRAPMTASATLTPRAGASDGFHRSTTCKFLAPVLRACSSAHRIPEPRDTDGCRRSPTATSARGRICFQPGIPRHIAVLDARSASLATSFSATSTFLHLLARPLQRTKS